MSWTDDRIGLLKRMWKEGKSAADIAKTLGKGVTRNAVIGKAHRMGLSGRPSPIKKPVEAKKAVATAVVSKKGAKEIKGGKKISPPVSALSAKSKLKSTAPKNPALLKEIEELKKIQKDVAPLGGGIALIDLTERMCKWPIGDPKEPDFAFCGLGIRPGTPYCPEHAAAAYQTSSRRGGAAAAAAAAAAASVVPEEKDEEEVEEIVEDDEVETVA